MNTPAYNRAYYEANKASRKAQIMDRIRRIRDEVQQYKQERGCSRCGYNKSAVALHFHHTGEKEHNISRMVAQGRNMGKIMEEIARCEVVCANCHAEIHANGPVV